ncbi:MAG: hypothetical protein PVI90_12295 [Desulfobacteraceae bacterium]|jgi:hypothetical protein
MNKIVDLKAYRTRIQKRKYFYAWEQRFNEQFDLHTCLGDISDKTLYRLAHPGDESSQAFYEFIMGVLNLGPAAKFGYLADGDKLRVVDIHLFLADNIRFELMRRLGWLISYAAQNECMVMLVKEAEKIKFRCQNQIPVLSSTHAEYENYQQLTPRDKDAFVRRLIAPALEEFKERM